MNNANLQKNRRPAKKSFGELNYDGRMAAAKGALNCKVSQRADVTLNHAILNDPFVRVHYVENKFHEKHAKIKLTHLIQHTLDVYSSKASDNTTVDVYRYLGENLDAVCLNYLQAGKEITKL